MQLSVVVPVFNEAANILPLVREIHDALSAIKSFEVIYVDDGSTDDSSTVLMQADTEFPRLRVVRHERSCGQSAAIVTGVKAAQAPWVVTLDGDGQNDPADIPNLVQAAGALQSRRWLITGWRQARRDTWLKRLSSRVANGVRRRLLQDDTPDTGCGLKLFPRDLFLSLPQFDHMHRFLPALVLRAGGQVQSVPVNHRPRQCGTSKYGLFDRLWVGIVDLFGVWWLQRRRLYPRQLENDE